MNWVKKNLTLLRCTINIAVRYRLSHALRGNSSLDLGHAPAWPFFYSAAIEIRLAPIWESLAIKSDIWRAKLLKRGFFSIRGSFM